MPTPSRPPLLGHLLVAAAVLGLAACAASDPSPASPTTAAPSPSPDAATTGPVAVPSPAATAASTPAGPAATAAALPRCTAAALTGSVRAGDAGAGQRSATLVLTNRSGRPCGLDGYGGVQLADAAGNALPTEQVRDPRTPRRSVTLAPGRSGHSVLRWTVVPGEGDATSGPCRPAPSSLRVIPPDERTALSVRWSLGPVCAGGRLTQTAYRPGTAAG